MKKFILNIFLLVLVLTGCGGGGGSDQTVSTQPIAQPVVTKPTVHFETPTETPIGKYRLARIDYRYDTPKSNYDKNGLHTTSFESVKPVIDNVKQIGFNGIIIQLQTPINKNTGKIGLYDTTDDKNIPKDTWKVVEYAKAQKLKVWLSLAIVDSVTDMLLTPDYTKYTQQQMFNNIIEYQRNLAIVAEKYNIEGIFISEGNYNMESYENLFYWKQLIDELRKVYTGKLSYATFLMMPTSIWNHVDYASINIGGTLSKTPVKHDLQTIINLYFNDVYNQNHVQLIKNFHMVYGKKFILSTSPTITDKGVNYLPEGFWDGLWAFSEPQTDKTLQLLKIRAFMEVVNKHLIDITDGIVFSEYDPWLQHVGFSVPNYKSWVYHYYCCGFDLTNNLEAQKTINSYFAKPWGHYTVQ